MPLELDRPVRLWVDLEPPPGCPPVAGRWWSGSRAADLLEGALDGLFLLHLAYPPSGPRGRRMAAELTGLAASRGVSVAVVLAAGAQGVEEIAAAGASEVALDLGEAPPSDFGSLLEDLVGRLRGSGARAGALWRTTGARLEHIVPLLAAARASGAAFLELPPPAAVYGGGAGFPLPADYRRLYRVLSSAGRVSRPDGLRVHDVLVAAMMARLGLLGPEDSGGFGGCQAAGALGYVGAQGTVYPCAALPLPLGEMAALAETGFWRREAVSRVRAQAAAGLAACARCRALARCRGGCPGARLALGGSMDSADPLCPAFEGLGG